MTLTKSFRNSKKKMNLQNEFTKWILVRKWKYIYVNFTRFVSTGKCTKNMNAKMIKKSIKYRNFHIDNAATKYTLHVNGYTGTLKDALKRHNRQKFSTFDSDNDGSSTANCASKLFGGWWFFHCHDSNLNRKYYSGG